jgi:hypothetical protein
MSSTEVKVDVDVDDARRAAESWERAMGEGGKDAVSQLSVLAEDAYKRRIPEGAGIPNVHARTTVQALPERRSVQKTIMAHKRTQEGWLLIRAIVGNPSTPTFTTDAPPVWIDREGGDAQGPVAQWADAKLGDQNAAWAVAENIKDRGTQLTFPQPVVRDSYRMWQSQVEEVANQAVAERLGGSR